MMAKIWAVIRGSVAALILGLNTVAVFALLWLPTGLKAAVPLSRVRRWAETARYTLACAWVRFNSVWMYLPGQPIEIDLRGRVTTSAQQWYLVTSNHQTWVDIFVLQKALYGKVPFLKFILKRELIWVPFAGLSWWMLDFPFVHRNRAVGGAHCDLASTQAACAKMKLVPTALLSFVEGTRCTVEKQTQVASPFLHLLPPKAMGVGVFLTEMGAQCQGWLDVSIVYPDGVPTFWDLLSGRVRRVSVHLRLLEVPAVFRRADLMQTKALRQGFAAWLHQQWVSKDQILEGISADVQGRVMLPTVEPEPVDITLWEQQALAELAAQAEKLSKTPDDQASVA